MIRCSVSDYSGIYLGIRGIVSHLMRLNSVSITIANCQDRAGIEYILCIILLYISTYVYIYIPGIFTYIYVGIYWATTVYACVRSPRLPLPILFSSLITRAETVARDHCVHYWLIISSWPRGFSVHIFQ